MKIFFAAAASAASKSNKRFYLLKTFYLFITENIRKSSVYLSLESFLFCGKIDISKENLGLGHNQIIL